eukprot:5403446-Amphidinium_carterae.2
MSKEITHAEHTIGLSQSTHMREDRGEEHSERPNRPPHSLIDRGNVGGGTKLLSKQTESATPQSNRPWERGRMPDRLNRPPHSLIDHGKTCETDRIGHPTV